MKKFILSFVVFGILASNNSIEANAAPVNAPVKKTVGSQTLTKPIIPAQSVSPLAIVDNPSIYLNKTVTFSGEFVSFTSLGLDYKPAFRDSSKFIGILIKRPDVKDHTIPLSELKIFMSRELAEKNIDIETGDKFTLTGKIFSTALGDPWLDITDFKMTTKKEKPNDVKKKVNK